MGRRPRSGAYRGLLQSKGGDSGGADVNEGMKEEEPEDLTWLEEKE